MKPIRALIALYLLASAPSAWAIYCFDFESNNQMCLQMKTQALITMMKLQNDPRFLSWTSEGKPGEKAAKEADQAMKLAQGCLTLIDCGAAAAKAQKVASSTPGYVKGDLGNFAGQIWYGAELPGAGDTLDKIFDNKRIPPDEHEASFTKIAGGGYEPPPTPDLPKQEAASKPMQSAPLTFSAQGAGWSSDAVALAAVPAQQGTDFYQVRGGATSVPDRGTAPQQAIGGVQYESQGELAAGTWQASGPSISGAGSSGFNVPFEMERRLGSALEEEGEGLTEGEPDSPQTTKPQKFASNNHGSAKKKVASDSKDVDPDKKRVREADAEPLTQSELASIIP